MEVIRPHQETKNIEVTPVPFKKLSDDRKGEHSLIIRSRGAWCNF